MNKTAAIEKPRAGRRECGGACQNQGASMKILPVLFEEREIRRLYDEKTETWFFSVVDIIQVLTQQPDYQAARNYWKVLKNRLRNEGSQLVTNCNQLKLTAEDGKQRLTDVATAETLDRKSTRLNSSHSQISYA